MMQQLPANRLAHNQFPKPDDALDAYDRKLMALVQNLVARTIRIETRLVVLMKEHGLSPDGKPLES